MDSRALHPYASFWLDVADKMIKLSAVLIGGLWTYWNYSKGRTYEQRLELGIDGDIYTGEALHGDVTVTVKNIGGTQHPVTHRGTFCVLSAIRSDLSEQRIKPFKVFLANNKLEPGESMNDAFCWTISDDTKDIVWMKLTLRVVSDGVEWTATRLFHVGNGQMSRS